MTETIAQSPSIEDLLSARSKRSNHNLATNSFYSTITTLSARTDLDISDAARLAMARESANPVWSPSMSSHYDDENENDNENENEDEDGSSTQGGHVNIGHMTAPNSNINSNSNTTDFPTPTISESDYSRSPSLASVRMAAIVQKTTPTTTSGLGISTNTTSTTTTITAPSSLEGHGNDPEEVTPTVSPTKRVLNARNLIINTSGSVGAAHAYPHESTTPSVAPPSSARIEHSPPPRRPPSAARSQSTLEASTISSTSRIPYSPMRTATMPIVPRYADPTASTSSPSTQSSVTPASALAKSQLVRRSSTDSSLSYLSSPLADEDDLADEDAALGPNTASLLRMQSFLGPKMKHISPAPWSIDGSSPNPEDRTSVVSTSSSVPASESAATTATSGRGSIWSEIDSEIGSVHMATKSTGRLNNAGTAATASKSALKDALGSTATGTLKGLGLAIANASAAVASAATGGSGGSGSATTSRPSISSERSTKSRTTTASSAFSTWSGTSRGTTNDGSNSKFNSLSRSHSHEPFDATNIPLPPMPASAGFPLSSYASQQQSQQQLQQQHQQSAAMKVTNIVRCKSPDGLPNVPASAPPTTTTTPGITRSSSPASNGPPTFFNHQQHRPACKNGTGSAAEVPFSQLATVTSAPETANHATTSSASACIALLSTSAPGSNASHGSSSNMHNGNNGMNARKQPAVPRKRPPFFHQDSTHSTTASTCTGESYNTTMTHSTSQTSLPANLSDPSDLASKAGTSPNGMKLISLADARERERERGNMAAEKRAEQIHQLQQHQHQQALAAQRALAALPAIPTAPISAPPPPPFQTAPPPKALKNKKSGFLRMFKHKDSSSSSADHPQMPPLPRPSTDSLPSPKMMHGFPGVRKASDPASSRDKILHIGSQSPNMENQNANLPKTPLRTDFASAVPFPHQQQQYGPAAKPQAGSEKPRSASQPNPATSEATQASSASPPPHVSLIKPSPDLAALQGAFASNGNRNLSPASQQKQLLGALSAAQSQDGLAPSLSLRPVSMMLSSMPPNFLADLEKSVNSKNAHLQANSGSSAAGIPGFDTISGRASPARTPDTPVFVFFDSDNNATPPSGHTPNTPAAEQFSNGGSPSARSSCHEQKSDPVFGLPTPPHSASSARTFSASSMPPLPISPSSTSESAREATTIAPLKARVSELEMLVISLRAELAATRGESIQVVLSDLTNTDLKKACNTCGCLCKTNASILSRPRMVGHGNMFSSGRN